MYGPWDRPDMALQKFAKAIINGEPIQLFNYGNHQRDFTYIDDIVEGVIYVLDKPAEPNPDWSGNNPDSGTSYAPWRIYNIGNNNPVELNDYINTLEKILGKKAEKELLSLQPGDVPDTYADIDDLIRALRLAVTTENIGGEAFQIASNKETTVGEITKKMVEILNQNGINDIDVINGETRLGDVKRNYSDTSKAKNRLGWQPTMSQDEGLKKTVEYFVK